MSWKDKKMYILKCIKAISDHWGGDVREWLIDYSKDLIDKNTEQLDKLIETFDDIMSKDKIRLPETGRHLTIDRMCTCNYRLPFCTCQEGFKFEADVQKD